MSAIDNPPAFPCGDGPNSGSQDPGMTLLDFFAAQALAGLLASPFDGPNGKGVAGHTEHFAGLAYQYGDSMLAERNRRQS